MHSFVGRPVFSQHFLEQEPVAHQARGLVDEVLALALHVSGWSR